MILRYSTSASSVLRVVLFHLIAHRRSPTGHGGQHPHRVRHACIFLHAGASDTVEQLVKAAAQRQYSKRISRRASLLMQSGLTVCDSPRPQVFAGGHGAEPRLRGGTALYYMCGDDLGQVPSPLPSFTFSSGGYVSMSTYLPRQQGSVSIKITPRDTAEQAIMRGAGVPRSVLTQTNAKGAAKLYFEAAASAKATWWMKA